MACRLHIILYHRNSNLHIFSSSHFRLGKRQYANRDIGSYNAHNGSHAHHRGLPHFGTPSFRHFHWCGSTIHHYARCGIHSCPCLSPLPAHSHRHIARGVLSGRSVEQHYVVFVPWRRGFFRRHDLRFHFACPLYDSLSHKADCRTNCCG